MLVSEDGGTTRSNIEIEKVKKQEPFSSLILILISV